ncbi:MAG: hypothetical protein VX988_00335 [Planctomycetota bacterium]|nr:hypothetical protein [Planctomycetota bacterium]
MSPLQYRNNSTAPQSLTGASRSRKLTKPNVDVETGCRAGSAKDGWLPIAYGWAAGVLVVGNSAGSLVLRKLFGETALRVIGNSDATVFVSP